jgi:hypothetical protein
MKIIIVLIIIWASFLTARIWNLEDGIYKCNNAIKLLANATQVLRHKL